MLMRRGDPTRLFMKPEKPVFFLDMALFGSFVSSEYLFGLISWASAALFAGIFSFMRSPDVKLVDCRNGGPMLDGNGLVYERGGGGGRRSEFW